MKQKHTQQYGTGGKSSRIKHSTVSHATRGNKPGRGDRKHPIETSAPTSPLHIRGPANKDWLS